ncbi:ethanolamine utilization protein EutN [Actinoplanes sp. Pm04-4]|uniref:Ethanolamine utilization protein EutN n=1 Tax=Paractinoplanes pyxinae TaxID=2997416 RepID=A0ABT4BAT6_9ACTN|nr:EutN/CcmL family microcompartment protein [Actinoplanes pyxinae]MCY1143632.1 ethanolamine utilization protein EutN [Actinoplanes pyxinae]
MHIGTVRETVVAPTRHPGLAGTKLLLVVVGEGTTRAEILAVDSVGAGVGDRVVVATGSHAVSLVRPQAPTDAVIVGIVQAPGTSPAHERIG